MRSKLGETFRFFGLSGQVTSQSDSGAIVDFGVHGFVNILTDCRGSDPCSVTVAISRSGLQHMDFERFERELFKFFDMEPTTRCRVPLCEPVAVAGEQAANTDSPSAYTYVSNLLATKSSRTVAAEIPAERVYSVPRRYDLASMFSISVAYAILFALLRALNSPPYFTLLAGGFFTTVGLAQALLFKGNRPREASIYAGTFYAAIGAIAMATVSGWGIRGAIAGTICSLFWSPVVGYLAGAVIGGIWLIADYLRQWLERRRDLAA